MVLTGWNSSRAYTTYARFEDTCRVGYIALHRAPRPCWGANLLSWSTSHRVHDEVDGADAKKHTNSPTMHGRCRLPDVSLDVMARANHKGASEALQSAPPSEQSRGDLVATASPTRPWVLLISQRACNLSPHTPERTAAMAKTPVLASLRRRYKRQIVPWTVTIPGSGPAGYP